jgi:DNA-binding NarL/FixJ family response regulator
METLKTPSMRMQGCCCHAKHFTQREIEVLAHVASGSVTAQIAGELYISKRTVEAHLAEMLRRSDTRTRAELVALCYVCGILSPGSWPPCPTGSYCLTRRD